MPDEQRNESAAMDEAELAQLIARVQGCADNGDTHQQVRGQLLQEGVDPEIVSAVVEKVFQPVRRERRPRAAASAGSGAGSWLVWLGILGLINLLSWLFDWPFWLY